MHILCWLVALITIADGRFSPNFEKFLRQKYGNVYADVLTRVDLGEAGSFGGGTSGNVTRRPIVMMHGLTGNAGGMGPLRAFYLSKGYNDSEVYATSYGPKGRNTYFDESGVFKCEYVEPVRVLIEAVLDYTGMNKINVIGYSMGVLITRKAILGGACVDTGTNLGSPLTEFIRNYIGIAGPNYGAAFCPDTKPPYCNTMNGFCCNSTYVNQLNRPITTHYEGEFVYAIQTIPDEIIGGPICGVNNTAAIPDANEIITTYGQLHGGVFTLSGPKQLEWFRRNP